MKIRNSTLSALIAALCCGAAGLCCGAPSGLAFAAGFPAATTTPAAAQAVNAAAQGLDDLGVLIAAGTLEDLRWPNFTDYRDEVKNSTTRAAIRWPGSKTARPALKRSR